MIAGVLAAPAVIASTHLGSAQPIRTLKLTHPFRMSEGDDGDMRDRLCRQFAAAVSNGRMARSPSRLHPTSRCATPSVFSASLRKGTLDISLYPISDAGKEFPELDIGLMPGLVTSYRQGEAWKSSPVSRRFADFLADKGIVILSFIWLAGGMASRAHPIVNPEDARGLKIRSGHHQMDAGSACGRRHDFAGAHQCAPCGDAEGRTRCGGDVLDQSVWASALKRLRRASSRGVTGATGTSWRR